jgi:hypothetical protein
MVSKFLHNLKVLFDIERLETSRAEHEMGDTVYGIAVEEYLGLLVSRCQDRMIMISSRKRT